MDKKYRPKFHIAPPQGWLNDPNGSCCINGKYYVFFQYSPDDPKGGKKYWGLMTSENMLDWNYEGIKISPDTEWDRDGAYSGTAYTADGRLEIFYTGNVKHPGDYDYINEGRGHNVLYTCMDTDSFSMADKEVILTNSDYPANMSCHVRDPKIWKEGDKYYMLLGARTRDSRAGALIFGSDDNRHYAFKRFYEPSSEQGYMWECPDYFEIAGKNILAVCPQGIKKYGDKYQNVNASGYFALADKSILAASDKELDQLVSKDLFLEWDKGFDFYAPQTFTDDKKRRILIGWAGVPDTPYDNAPSVAEGWQHSMTLPRELEYKDGRLYQRPVRELDNLDWDAFGGTYLEYQSLKLANLDVSPLIKDPRFFRIRINDIDEVKDQIPTISINKDLELTLKNGIFKLEFLNDSGSGRDERYVRIDELTSLDIIMDGCLLEIFINDGQEVMTSRYYPKV